MDDGAKEENLWLTTFLQAKFGIESTINVDRSRYRLRVRGSSMNLLKELVTPHIIPSMLYKLSP